MAKTTFTEAFVGTSFMTTFKTNLIAWVKSFVGTKINSEISKMGNVMKIKGKVATKETLPTDATAGDVYLVGTESDEDCEEYVRTANNTWEFLGVAGGTSVDLSGYTSNKDLFAGEDGTGTAASPADGTIFATYNQRIKDLEDTVASITMATDETLATFPTNEE